MTVVYESPTVVITQDGISGNRANAFIADMTAGVVATAADRVQTGLDRASATASAASASASAASAAASAASAALYDGPWLDTVAALIADTSLTYTPALPGTVVAGDYVKTRAEGFAGTVLASGTPVASPYIQTSGSVVLQMLPDGRGAYSTKSFGTGNLSDQFARALDAVRNDRAISAEWLNDTAGIIIPRGLYNLDAPLVVSAVSGFNLYAYGAVIRNTSGSFTPFKITASANAKLFGVALDLRNNNVASEAFHVAGSCGWLTVNDLMVQSNSSNVGFAAVRMQQGNASGLDDNNRDKGNFWNTFNGFWHRKLSGADANTSAAGFDVQGCNNALRINNSSFGNIGTGILVRNQNNSLLSGSSNDIQLLQCTFEGFTTGFKFQMDGGATGGFASGSAIGCRFESGTTAFESATTNQPSGPLVIVGTTRISNVTNLVVDARTTKDTFNVIGGSITPSNEQRFTSYNRVTFGNLAGATGDPCVELLPRTASSGGTIALRRTDGAVDGKISQMAGGGLEIDGGTLGRVIAKNITGLSGGSTHASNFRGSITLPGGATSVAVTFGTAEPDTSYAIHATFQRANGGFWIDPQSTGGFTINVTTPFASPTTVRWLLIR